MSFITVRSSELLLKGPLIELELFPPASVIKTLKEKRMDVPVFRGNGLIDTGASGTAIDLSIAKSLNLISHNKVFISTPSGKNSEHYTYDIGLSLTIDHQAPRDFEVIATNLRPQQHMDVLIGRDVLENCTLFYNGKDSSYIFHM